jgi:hypothetical protein
VYRISHSQNKREEAKHREFLSMNLRDDIELFDDYLGDALDGESRAAFEQRMKTDERFKRDFEDYTIAVNVVKTAAAGQHIRSLLATEPGKKTGLMRSRFAIGLSVAACVALLIAFFVWPFGKPSDQNLFEKHFRPYPNILASRSGLEGRLHASLEQYSTGNYAGAVALMNEIPVKSDTLYFYSAVSSLHLRNTEAAITALDNIGENSVFHQQVKWYQGLAYLLQGEHEMARRSLVEIGPSEYKYQEAQAILTLL